MYVSPISFAMNALLITILFYSQCPARNKLINNPQDVKVLAPEHCLIQRVLFLQLFWEPVIYLVISKCIDNSKRKVFRATKSEYAIELLKASPESLLVAQ